MLDVRNKQDVAQLSEVQRFFHQRFAELRTDGGRGPVPFGPFPVLQHRHVRNCRVFPDRHAMLVELAKREAVCAEVGVFRGDFSDFMIQDLAPAELYLLDIDFETHRVRERFSAEIQARRVIMMEGDSSTSLMKFPDAHLDWVYVDGDHTYEGCKKDLDAALPKVKQDGVIFLNDYIMWSHTECRPYGVVPAANEMCVTHNLEMIGFALHNAMYCDVAFRRTGSVNT